MDPELTPVRRPPAAMDTRVFRRLFGHFATGVTVITSNAAGILHGMTANAVCSVSLEPMLVLVCVDVRATCHEQVVSAGSFGINILAADQRHLSDLFARTEPAEQGRLRGADYRLARCDVPVLDGALAWVACRLVDRHRGGDHDIFVGEVVEGAVERAGDAPLLFFRGGYGGFERG